MWEAGGEGRGGEARRNDGEEKWRGMHQYRKFEGNEDDNNDYSLQHVSFMVDQEFSMFFAVLPRFLVPIFLRLQPFFPFSLFVSRLHLSSFFPSLFCGICTMYFA